MVKNTPTQSDYCLTFFLMVSYVLFNGQTFESTINSISPLYGKITPLSALEKPAAFLISVPSQHALQVKQEFPSSHNGFKAQISPFTYPFLRLLDGCASLSFFAPHDFLILDQWILRL